MKTIIFILALLLPIYSFSQGLIINEISNGIDTVKEYYELLVIGSQINPTGNVNLSGWIIDDNNGDFELQGSDVGIASGHLRIAAGCLTSVKPGSIILIYNDDELSFVNDENDTNEDCVYILPVTSSCIENTTTLPTTANGNYSPVVYNSIKIWDRIGLRNAGDAAQVRKPNGSFYHGFSYGNVSTVYPSFPSELGGTSSFNIPSTGTSMTYNFSCGSFTNRLNYARESALTKETPGAANNNANRYFINAVRMGTYDYSNLSNPANCGTLTTLDCAIILSNNLLYFDSDVDMNKITLKWKLSDQAKVKFFILQKSNNGIEYYDLATTEKNEYTDNTYESINYYRLKIIEYDIAYYSDIINYNIELINDLVLYPNPSNGIVNINKQVDSIIIYNELGTQVSNYDYIDNIIKFNDYKQGCYYIKLIINNNTVVKKIIMQ